LSNRMILPVQEYIKTPIISRQVAQNRCIPNKNPRLEATGLARCRLCEKDSNPIRIDEYNLHIFTEHPVLASLLYYSFHAPLNTPQLKIEFQKNQNRTLNQLKRWYSSVQRPDCGRALEEIILEHEIELKRPFLKEKENQYAARSAFARLLISEKFAIKEEIGDPPAIARGACSHRNARRTKLVEYYKKKVKEANEPIVIDSKDTVDDVIVVEDRVVQPKKKRKLNSSAVAPVVILDDSDEEKTTEMDTQDDDIPITKLIEKGEKMVNKLETVKNSLNEVKKPQIVVKDMNDNQDFFGAQKKPSVSEDASSSSSSEEEEEVEEPEMPSVVKFVSAYPDKPTQQPSTSKKRKFEEPIPDSIAPVDLLKPSPILMQEKKEKFAKRGIDLSKSRFQELNPPKLNLPKLPKRSKNPNQGASKMSQRFGETSNSSQYNTKNQKNRRKGKKFKKK